MDIKKCLDLTQRHMTSSRQISYIVSKVSWRHLHQASSHAIVKSIDRDIDNVLRWEFED